MLAICRTSFNHLPGSGLPSRRPRSPLWRLPLTARPFSGHLPGGVWTVLCHFLACFLVPSGGKAHRGPKSPGRPSILDLQCQDAGLFLRVFQASFRAVLKSERLDALIAHGGWAAQPWPCPARLNRSPGSGSDLPESVSITLFTLLFPGVI